MMLSEAKRFHEYARECLQLAEQAAEPDIKKHLIELSHIWMEAALKEERHILDERAPALRLKEDDPALTLKSGDNVLVLLPGGLVIPV